MTSQRPKTNECLEWFEENLELVIEMAQLCTSFQLHFFKGLWKAGFTYLESYDGTYFMEYLSGEGKTAEEALRNAVEKSRPVINLMAIVKKEVKRPASFELGCQYAMIQLDRSSLSYTKVTKSRVVVNGEIFKCDQTGSELLIGLRSRHLIFDIPPPEIEKQLLGSA